MNPAPLTETDAAADEDEAHQAPPAAARRAMARTGRRTTRAALRHAARLNDED